MSNSHISTLATAITNKISTIVNNHNSSNDAHSSLFAAKSDIDHIHSQYLTNHQDISGKIERTSEDTIQIYQTTTDDTYCKECWQPWGQYQGLTSLTNSSFTLTPYGEGGVMYVNHDEEDVELTVTVDTNSVSCGINTTQTPTLMSANTPYTFTVSSGGYVSFYDSSNSSSNVTYAVKTFVDSQINSIANIIYPVGSIYMSVNSTSPSLLFGGEWSQLKDRFLLGAGDTYANGATGGAATVSLTKQEMPRHTHTQNAHTHTQNSHSHTIGSLTRYTITGKGAAAVGNGYGNTNDYTTGGTTATNKDTTATNKYTGGTNTNEAEQNGKAHENMPPYLTVYIWKRTA